MSQNDTKMAQQTVNAALALYDAKVKAGQANPLNEIQPVRLNLTVGRTKENALKLSFPFKSMRVAAATDLKTFITLVPENNDSGRSGTRLGLLDSLETEYGFSSCYVYWDAQPSKEIVLEFFTTSKVNNGRLVIEQGTLAPDTYTIGPITAQNDGSTFISRTDMMLGRASIASGQVFDMGLESFPSFRETDTIYSGAFAYTATGIKVPTGFKAELIAWRAYMKSIASPADLAITELVLSICSAPLTQNFNSIHANITVPLAFNKNNNLFEGSAFFKRINADMMIDENRVFSFLNNNGGAINNNLIIEVMYRFIPKVV